MANWHVNPETGNPGRCGVDYSKPNHRGCPFGLGQSEHFGSAIEAVRSYSEARELQEDPFATVTAAERKLDELTDPDDLVWPREEDVQYIPEEVAQKSFWGRNGKKIGGAIVATFLITTVSSLVLNGAGGENADGVAPQGDSSLVEEAPLEEPLPPAEEEAEAESAPEDATEELTAEEKGEKAGAALSQGVQDGWGKIKEQATPERVEKAKDFGQTAKDYLGGLLSGVLGDSGASASDFDFGWTDGGSSIELPTEVSEGVQFQGKSLQPTAEEIASATETLQSLDVRPDNEDYYYNRKEQYGRSFQTGVVGQLERRDVTNGVFKNDSPQARAIGGNFVDPYTGETVEIIKGSSTDTNVEHIVPLHEVAKSEDPSNPLSPEQKISIANDFDNLQITGSKVNQQKGDKDPGKWMPPNEASHARYAIATINVKSKYGLSIDQAEHDALASVLASRQ